jgi:hypothetical protein
MEINPAVRDQIARLGNGARAKIRVRTEEREREAVWLSHESDGRFAVIEKGSWTILHPVMVEQLELIEHPGITAVRDLLRAMRLDEQGGYLGRGPDGTWHFGSMGLGQVTPDQLDALFDLVDLVPEPIVSLGHCRDCLFSKPYKSKDGQIGWAERGYSNPCSPCKRPKMSNFEPRHEPFVACSATKAFGPSDNRTEVQCLCPEGHHPASEHVAYWNDHPVTWKDTGCGLKAAP